MKILRVVTQLIFLLAVEFCGRATAQSTIFNIPTTDTVSKGKAYAELDFMPQLPRTDAARTYMYNPRFVAGAPGGIELGVNFPVFNTRGSGESETSAYVQPNAKWQFWKNEKAGLAAATGLLWNAPLNHRHSQDSWGLLYGLVSEKIKAGGHGPRLHAGAYGVVSANQDPNKGPVSFWGTRAGAILGYEQPVYRSISFVADWFSGKNGIGYFTPGVSVALPRNSLLNAGYSIGNETWDNDNASKNRYVFLYYGICF